MASTTVGQPGFALQHHPRLEPLLPRRQAGEHHQVVKEVAAGPNTAAVGNPALEKLRAPDHEPQPRAIGPLNSTTGTCMAPPPERR